MMEQPTIKGHCCFVIEWRGGSRPFASNRTHVFFPQPFSSLCSFAACATWRYSIVIRISRCHPFFASSFRVRWRWLWWQMFVVWALALSADLLLFSLLFITVRIQVNCFRCTVMCDSMRNYMNQFWKKNNSFLAAISATVDGDGTDDLPRAMEKGIRVAVGAWNESVTAGPIYRRGPGKKCCWRPHQLQPTPERFIFLGSFRCLEQQTKWNDVDSSPRLL